MLAEHSLLSEEFPEFKHKINDLQSSNTEFADLYQEYIDTDAEIARLEQEHASPSDTDTEDLRKKRMMLKVRLYWLISQDS